MKETDQQLIELLEQKTPDELTLEEIENLHRQLTRSAELRVALREQLRFEQSLADALGRVHVSVDSIFEQAEKQRARNRRFAWLGLLGCVVVGMGVWYQLYGQALAPPIAKAPPEDVPPVEGEPVAETPDEPDPPSKVPAEGVRKTEPGDDAKPDDEPESRPPPAEPKPPQTGPWMAADQLGGPQVPLAELLVRDVDAKEPLTAELAKQWLVPVDGQRSKIQYTVRPSRVEVEGVHRMAAPWPNDALLRINADHRQDSVQRWYFWNGQDGVLLQPAFSSRAVVRLYAVTRDGKSPLPNTAESVASGSSQWFRDGTPGAGWLDIRHQDGELVVGYSGIRLASAPLADAPTDVFFEGRDSVYAIRMARCGPYPAAATKPPTVVANLDRPASLDWKTSKENAEALERSDDGSIRLTSKAANKARHAWFDIKFDPKVPLREWVFELADVSAGTSVYFGNETGGRMQEVRIVRDPKTKRKHLRGTDGDNVIERSPDHNGRHVVWVGDRLWLRLVVVGSFYRSYASRDGLRWTDLGPFAQTNTIASLGVSAAHPQQDEHPTITVSKIQVRGYQAINSLAQPDLVAAAEQHVASLASASTEDKWKAATSQCKPEKVSLDDWQIACAVATLAKAANNKGAVAQILRTCVDSSLDLPAKLQLFDEVATAAPLKHDEGKSIGEMLGQEYARLADEQITKGNARPFSTVGERALRSPIEANARPIVLVGAAAHEILSLVDDRQLDLAGRFASRLERLHSKELASTIAWANAVARKDPSVASADWKHPLQTRLDKEEFNVLAELQAAIDGKDFEDVCRVISSSQFAGSHGVMPTPEDPRLWISFPELIGRAIGQHPRLLEVMREKYADRGLLRVRGAIAEGDAEAAADATLQFYGTVAAAEAHTWLGDRALAGGDFSRSVRHYEAALEAASKGMRDGLLARQRFAWSMLGRPFGEPVTMPVTLGDVELAPKEFENLVQEMLEHRGRDPSKLVGRLANAKQQDLPKPAAYKQKKRLSLKARNNPKIDGANWSRLSTVCAAGDQLYFQTPWSIIAVDAKRGDKLWQADLPIHSAAHKSAFVHTPPIVTDRRVFLRWFNKKGPGMIALTRANGKIEWESPVDSIMSNPVIVGGELVALTSERLAGNDQIYITTFDPSSGEIRVRSPLFSLRHSWRKFPAAGLVAHNGKLLATIGGTVVRFDAEGKVHWQREQTWAPLVLGTDQTRQPALPPLIAEVEGRWLAIVSQPGVPTIECLELGSGRRLWRRIGIGANQILGVAGTNVIVHDGQRLHALHAADGKTRWSKHKPGASNTHLYGPKQLVSIEMTPAKDPKTREVSVVWRDASSGKTLARGSSGVLWQTYQERDFVYLGPTIWYQGSWFLAPSTANHPKDYEMVQLVPSGKPATKPTEVAMIRGH